MNTSHHLNCNYFECMVIWLNEEILVHSDINPGRVVSKTANQCRWRIEQQTLRKPMLFPDRAESTCLLKNLQKCIHNALKTLHLLAIMSFWREKWRLWNPTSLLEWSMALVGKWIEQDDIGSVCHSNTHSVVQVLSLQSVQWYHHHSDTSKFMDQIKLGKK